MARAIAPPSQTAPGERRRMTAASGSARGSREPWPCLRARARWRPRARPLPLSSPRPRGPLGGVIFSCRHACRCAGAAAAGSSPRCSDDGDGGRAGSSQTVQRPARLRGASAEPQRRVAEPLGPPSPMKVRRGRARPRRQAARHWPRRVAVADRGAARRALPALEPCRRMVRQALLNLCPARSKAMPTRAAGWLLTVRAVPELTGRVARSTSCATRGSSVRGGGAGSGSSCRSTTCRSMGTLWGSGWRW